MYQKNEGDVRLNVAMIDLVDKEGNLILTQTNKFRGKEYTDDRYFDDDLIAYRWADLLLLRAEAYAALDKIPKAIIDLDEVRNRARLQGYDGPTDKASVEKKSVTNAYVNFFWNKNAGMTLFVFTSVEQLTSTMRFRI